MLTDIAILEVCGIVFGNLFLLVPTTIWRLMCYSFLFFSGKSIFTELKIFTGIRRIYGCSINVNNTNRQRDISE